MAATSSRFSSRVGGSNGQGSPGLQSGLRVMVTTVGMKGDTEEWEVLGLETVLARMAPSGLPSCALRSLGDSPEYQDSSTCYMCKKNVCLIALILQMVSGVRRQALLAPAANCAEDGRRGIT